MTEPINSPTSSVTMIAGISDQWSLTFNSATIVAPKPMTEATDRSNSPAVNDTISPSVMTS